MNSISCRQTILAAMAVVLAWPACANAATGNAEAAFKIPLLSVEPDDAGSCQQVGFTFSRKAGGTAPLSVAIGENTPGGVGESLRASVWMAAMVAALDRSDDMAGVRISLEVSGPVDGPSAGAAICLAILSALDGKAFPSDCVMTGTIMPDGTVGCVGSVAAKMRAASKAGAKRVMIPAYLRFESDAKSGQEADLKRLAQELKLEFLPVENIAQAYRSAHRLPRLSVAQPDHGVLELPEATEELLKTRYRERLNAGTKIWDAIPEADRKAIEADPATARMLLGPRAKAASAFRAGRLLSAYANVRDWEMLLNARQRNVAFLTTMPADNQQEAVAAADEKIAELLRAIPAAPSLAKASVGKIHWAGLQLCADYCETSCVRGMLQQLQAGFDGTLAEMAKEENKDQAKQGALYEQAWHFKALQLAMAHYGVELGGSMVDEASRLGGTLPHRAVTGDPAGVERLFYSASAAANNSFRKEVLDVWATALNSTPQQALAAMMNDDLATVLHVGSADALDVLHRDLGKQQTPGDARFATVLAAHTAANGLASVSELIMRWSALDVRADEQHNLRYGRTDLLNYLLNTARENALASIGQCRAATIPCVGPVLHFESAELRRDDPDEDKVSVLADYWKASLQAKVLLMLFQNGATALPRTRAADAARTFTPVPAPGLLWPDRQPTSPPAPPSTQPQSGLNKAASVARAANGVQQLWNGASRTGDLPSLPTGVSVGSGAIEHVPHLPAAVPAVTAVAGKPGSGFFSRISAGVAAVVAAIAAACAAIAKLFKGLLPAGAGPMGAERHQDRPAKSHAVRSPDTAASSTEVGLKLAGALNWPSSPPAGPPPLPKDLI